MKIETPSVVLSARRRATMAPRRDSTCKNSPASGPASSISAGCGQGVHLQGNVALVGRRAPAKPTHPRSGPLTPDKIEQCAFPGNRSQPGKLGYYTLIGRARIDFRKQRLGGFAA